MADNTIDSGCSQDPKAGKPCPEIWLIPICPIKNPSTGAFIDARASEPYHDTVRECLAPRSRSELARISRTSPEVTYPMPSRTKQNRKSNKTAAEARTSPPDMHADTACAKLCIGINVGYSFMKMGWAKIYISRFGESLSFSTCWLTNLQMIISH